MRRPRRTSPRPPPISETAAHTQPPLLLPPPQLPSPPHGAHAPPAPRPSPAAASAPTPPPAPAAVPVVRPPATAEQRANQHTAHEIAQAVAALGRALARGDLIAEDLLGPLGLRARL